MALRIKLLFAPLPPLIGPRRPLLAPYAGQLEQVNKLEGGFSLSLWHTCLSCPGFPRSKYTSHGSPGRCIPLEIHYTYWLWFRRVQQREMDEEQRERERER